MAIEEDAQTSARPRTRNPEAEAATALNRRHYFPALDGLRFFAFLLIFIHHSFPDDLFTVSVLEKMHRNTWAGVDLFFVLSGFLISYLLFIEEDRRRARTGVAAFSIGRFWIRRSLRIWPLYFLALFIALYVMPNVMAVRIGPLDGSASYRQMVEQHGWAAPTFLMNWTSMRHGYPISELLAPLWSVCVEEQFYLLWPLTLLFLKRERRLKVMIGVIVIAHLAKIPFGLLDDRSDDVDYLWIYVNPFLRADTLLIGAVIAHWMVTHDYAPPRIGRNWKIALGLMLIALCLLGRIQKRDTEEMLAGYILLDFVAGGAIILCLTTGSLFERFLRNPILVWLGRISFGLYVYHNLSIRLVAHWIVHFVNPADHLLYYSVRVPLSLALCIAISAVSYYGVERWFLKLKLRFTVVESRPGG